MSGCWGGRREEGMKMEDEFGREKFFGETAAD